MIVTFKVKNLKLHIAKMETNKLIMLNNDVILILNVDQKKRKCAFITTNMTCTHCWPRLALN